MARYICESCMTLLESTHVHDFRFCPGVDGKPCENETFVDGGNAYNRIGGKDLRKIVCLDYVDNSKSQLKRLKVQLDDNDLLGRPETRG